MSNSVLLHKENGIGFITFNRADKYNSFNREMALTFQAHLDDCAADNAVRCIYVTGSGKAFCAGQDLAETADPRNVDFEKIVGQHYNPVINRLRNIEKPIVAAINGVAAGAGANIALACDIVVATQSASFIQAFSKIGLIPDSAGTFFLPRYIGMQRAAALMMLGDKVTADEAVDMGMIYKVYSDDSFEISSKQLAQTLASMPTKGLGLTKRLLNQSYNNNLDQQVELEMRIQVEAGKTEDFVEGVNAFLEKRKPVFKGQ